LIKKKGERKIMKKKTLLLIPILVIFIAAIGYSFNQKKETAEPKAKQLTQTAVPTKKCETKQSCCEPCCEQPKPVCEPCKACEICPPCEPCKPCCTEVPKTGEPCNCAYNAPARIDPACGWDAWGSISFIYWQAKEKGLDVGYHFTLDSTGNHQKNEPLYLDFDYNPGFKIGAGMSFCRDDWTLYLEYTRLEGKGSISFDLSDSYGAHDYVQSIWGLDLVDIPGIGTLTHSGGKGKWELDYNMFDLELGRPYYLGRKLVFKPHYGLRAGWIDQNIKLESVTPFMDEIVIGSAHASQDSWLIGPRAGVDTDWLLSCNFRIFGNLAGSLTYQNFNATNKEIAPASPFIAERDVISKEEISYLTPNVEFGLGIGYGTYFCNNEWYFDLTVGYDFNYFWNQNQMRHVQDGHIYYIDGDSGNLMLHGLNITARLDF
jgi:hypothetical protein